VLYLRVFCSWYSPVFATAPLRIQGSTPTPRRHCTVGEVPPMGGGKPTYHYLASLNRVSQKRASHSGLYHHLIATTNHTRGGLYEGGFTPLTEASTMTHTHMCGACPRPTNRLPHTARPLIHYSEANHTPQRTDSHTTAKRLSCMTADSLSHESSDPFTGDGSPRPLCRLTPLCVRTEATNRDTARLLHTWGGGLFSHRRLP